MMLIYKDAGNPTIVPLAELFELNPWWTDTNLINDDPKILAWEKSESNFSSLDEIGFESVDAVYSLRGPRQVGKTTLIKLKIKDLLGKKVRDKNVFYNSFDLGGSPKDVNGILREYLAWSGHGDGERRFLFLDEISSVFDWQLAIKSLKDLDRLRDCTVVTAGSHSVDLRRSAETLPGRRGSPSDSLDKVLLPMSFGRYVAAVDGDLGRAIQKSALGTRAGRLSVFRDLARGKIPEDLAHVALMQRKLDSCLDGYMLSGGMPLAAVDFACGGIVTDRTYKTYLDAAESVIGLAGKNRSKTYQIAANIAASSGSPVSWSSLRRDTDVGSHHTAEEYVGMLEDMFAVSSLHRYDATTNRPKFGTGKKVYFRDPLFAHVLSLQGAAAGIFEQSLGVLKDPEAKGRLAEQIVADHLTRLAPELSLKGAGFDPAYAMMYWRSSKSGREVDFVVRDRHSVIPVEVKYQARVRRDDLWGLTDFAKATGVRPGIVVSRDDLRVEGPAVLVPASVFLLLA